MQYSQASLPTKYGIATIHVFEENNKEHCGLVFGDIGSGSNILCRVHSSCITGDVFHSLKCDCGEQLHKSLEVISEKGGVLIYLSQEGRGIGLLQKIRAYSLQDEGFNTIEAQEKLGLPIDAREYKIVKSILEHLNIRSIQLITNNPDKVEKLTKYGVTITNTYKIQSTINKYNNNYLAVKRDQMGHNL